MAGLPHNAAVGVKQFFPTGFEVNSHEIEWNWDESLQNCGISRRVFHFIGIIFIIEEKCTPRVEIYKKENWKYEKE